MKTFRIDDIGASTKRFEQYSKIKGGNFWFLKRLPYFKAWGPYNELTADEWRKFLSVFKAHDIAPIIAITASWVDRHSQLVPFPEKFPEAAAALKQAFKLREIVIANHGLTHCIVGEHLPRFRGSNRKSHREFYPNFDESYHREHIERSQAILEDYFGTRVEIFVPPGSVWSIKTCQALRDSNIKQVISHRYMMDSDEMMQDIAFVDGSTQIAFHDRELKLLGENWLNKQINKLANE